MRNRPSSIRCTPLFDQQDADLSRLLWNLDTDGYAVVHVNTVTKIQGIEGIGRMVRAHRVVMGRILGRYPLSHELCDHINGLRLDNRRSNLRLVTKEESNQNRRHWSSSGFRGVTREGKKWRAVVKHRGKTYRCGRYDTPEKADEVASAKRRELGFITRAVA